MPKVTIEVWSSLSHLFEPNKRARHIFDLQIEEGATLARVLQRLAEDNPSFAKVMYKPMTREPSGSVTVVVNGRLPEVPNRYETRLNEGDRVVLVQAYAGG